MEQTNGTPLMENWLYGFGGKGTPESHFLGDTAVYLAPNQIDLSSSLLAHYSGFRIELSDEAAAALAGEKVLVLMPGGGSLTCRISKTLPGMTTVLTISNNGNVE